MKNKKILYFLFLVLFISCKSNDVEEIITAPQPVLGSEIFLKNVDDSFTFCVIPDTQRYFHNALQNDRHKSYPINHYEIGNRHMQWIAKNSEKNGSNRYFGHFFEKKKNSCFPLYYLGLRVIFRNIVYISYHYHMVCELQFFCIILQKFCQKCNYFVIYSTKF